MRTAVYIGAGYDVRPVQALVQHGVRRFIYVDPQPSSEFPTIDWVRDGEHNVVSPGDTLRRPRMVDEVIHQMAKLGLYISQGFHILKTPFVVRFERKKDGVCVLYHFNTAFTAEGFVPANTSLNQMVAEADTLIVAGYAPHRSIADMMNSGRRFHAAMFERTFYGVEDDDDEHDRNSVIRLFHEHPERAASLTMYCSFYVAVPCGSMAEVVEVSSE